MQHHWWRILILASLLVAVGVLAGAQGQTLAVKLAPNQLIAFLGDSITQQNLYTRDVEIMLNARYPELHLRYVNVGWSGRHSAHLMDDAVLERDLLRLKPDVVFVLFGTNDGWYQTPPSIMAFSAYQTNMNNLVSKILAALPNTQIVLLTPTIVDVVVGAGIKGYNEALGQMAQYLCDLAARRGLSVIDLFNPMLQVDTAAKRANASFTMLPDAIHPNPSGHWLIATLIGQAMGVTPPVQIRAEINAETGIAITQQQTKVTGIKKQGDSLFFTQTFPRLPVALPLEARGALAFAPVQSARDKAVLMVSKLTPKVLYGVYQNERFITRVTGEDLAAGIEWTNCKREDPLTERLLQLTMQKFQYRWTAWRAPGVGLAEITPQKAKSNEWREMDTALTHLTQQADKEELQVLESAKITTWRVSPEYPITIPNWQVTGPYIFQSAAIRYPPENGIGKQTWSVFASGATGGVDFFPTYGQYRNSVVFARARIYLPHEASIALSTGSEGGLRMWVNSVICIDRETMRTLQPDIDAGVAPLQAGWNTILVRSVRGTKSWSFALQAYLSGITFEELTQVKISTE